MVSQNALAVKSAMSLLGTGQVAVSKETVQVIPTAKTRAALDYLSGSNLEQLTEDEVNLRELSADLFNWDETSGGKATKTVIRALNTALTTPGKYAHTVELVGFLAAAAPYLEPDRIARLFSLVDEVNTAFAPTRYTLQFHSRIGKVFSRYPAERREKLLRSAWLQAHNGRWWDLTAGVQADAGNIEPADVNLGSPKEIVIKYVGGDLPWSPPVAEAFRTLPEKYRDVVVGFLRSYRHDWSMDKPVDPDVALLASYIPWLSSDERLESPVSGLLDILLQVTSTLENYRFPDKPRSFTELFPNIMLYETTEFPFTPTVLGQDRRALTKDSSLEVVRNSHQLQENRQYMGNCTWSYKNRMEKGEYVLFRIHQGNTVYNGSMTLDKKQGTWRLGEINSRHNRGGVPEDIRAAFRKFISELRLSKTELAQLELVSTAPKNRSLKRRLRYQT